MINVKISTLKAPHTLSGLILKRFTHRKGEMYLPNADNSKKMLVEEASSSSAMIVLIIFVGDKNDIGMAYWPDSSSVSSSILVVCLLG